MRFIPTKEESQFKHPLPKQWLRPYLVGLDDLSYGRWEYWMETILAGKPLDAPIPKIHFDGHPHAETVKNIKNCINFMSRKGHGPRDSWMAFIDWLLWGFGSHLIKEFPEKVSEDISWH